MRPPKKKKNMVWYFFYVIRLWCDLLVTIEILIVINRISNKGTDFSFSRIGNDPSISHISHTEILCWYICICMMSESNTTTIRYQSNRVELPKVICTTLSLRCPSPTIVVCQTNYEHSQTQSVQSNCSRTKGVDVHWMKWSAKYVLESRGSPSSWIICWYCTAASGMANVRPLCASQTNGSAIPNRTEPNWTEPLFKLFKFALNECHCSRTNNAQREQNHTY